MTTIAQLPPAASVGSSDLLPLSQDGVLYSVAVAQLTLDLQPLIEAPTGTLLGRQSLGTGGPETITVGTGLSLAGGAVSANGADHAGFPVQAAFSLADEVVINHGVAPWLLPVTALRALFSAGQGVSIDSNGVVTVTASAIAGPAGPAGPIGAAGPAGPTGPAGPSGSGLAAPGASNSVSAIGASDYVAIWQNGANAWMPYGQFIGGQTINQLPAAGPAADSDEILVAQGSNALSVQGFGAFWTYLQAKLPSFKPGVVELTGNTVLDATDHNNRILIASAPLTMSANFANMGPGFSCTLINLASGSVTMGTGITSGSGGTSLPPGASTTLLGLAYSGGSLVWWSGIVQNAPTLTVGSIAAPAPDTAFTVSGGVFNDAPTALDYSTDGGATWRAASSPVISANAYSFTLPGLTAGTYAVRVRDHANPAVVGASNSFAVLAPAINISAVPSFAAVNVALTIVGTVSPGNAAVRVGVSASSGAAPASWVNATVSNGSWTASVTPAASGTIYIWAQQAAATAVQAVSSAISVVTPTLTVSAPGSGTTTAAPTITGSVAPASDAVKVQLTTQNAAAPTSGWSAASNTSGSFSAALTPAAAGTYYAWAEDPSTGLTAVSSAITVSAVAAASFSFNNPGGSYTHGSSSTIPLNGGVSPSQDVATQVALSTSNAAPPSGGWESATLLQGNTFWAIYYPVPAAAGAYYVWVETSSGGSQTVSSFTISVT